METKSYIFVQTRKEGFHFWKDAKGEVAFLKYPHRHMFYFKVYIEITHKDREIEFFTFKKDVQLYIMDVWKTFNLHDFENTTGPSCEMISELLYRHINIEYPKRDVIIEISEDDENGSRIEYKTHRENGK